VGLDAVAERGSPLAAQLCLSATWHSRHSPTPRPPAPRSSRPSTTTSRRAATAWGRRRWRSARTGQSGRTGWWSSSRRRRRRS